MVRLTRQTKIVAVRWLLWAGVWLVGALAFAPAQTAAQLGGTSPDTAVGEVVQRVLVKVNGDIVTQTELENRQIQAIRNRGVQPATDAELARLLQEVTPGLISGAVDELLLTQRGRELGYTLSDEQFDDMVEGIRQDNNFTSDEAFNMALAREGMTLVDLRELFEQQMLISQVQQVEVLSKVTLTEVEAREYYDANLAAFTEPGTVTMREILVRIPESANGLLAEAADSAAFARAMEARQRVLAGEDFATVAISVSDAASKANGGLIGPLDVAVVSEQVAEALDELELGELSEPIRTPIGYQILQLEARTRPEPQPFEAVEDLIANTVFNDRRSEEYGRFLNELRAEADIEWKDEGLRVAYESYEPDRTQRLADGQ